MIDNCLTLFRPTDFSKHVDGISMELPILYFKWSHIEIT